ncbi:LacI family transcriptional regulator [Acidipropionibacterium acidipropionici]|uniref:LacI family transcriptional regulator n=1 Tax=Acidipropionibacterium acidipropionici TaxID=1748 RepID=A0AAC8YFX8_9ACTN|nr:LacI family DNA-binding transcriptional regulator [Acidipropionibacterium acidipropionici]AMS05963.1 LacI family transcriptional regulator [Acidipropionibacterium acidipropionici]AOZ47425.1 LacI family transcriptional regulator [Acidipropionibacterium acidipropionici]AZP36458.1 LacI family transcriptional regulator [Acidipropionibacterium acidipropionici]
MAETGQGRPTIRDVAEAAGVATSTVSRAFSRPGRVSTETAERIYRVARELGYRQAPVPHLDLHERTRLVAMCVADVMNPVFSAMTKGAYAGAAEAGYGVVLVDANESAEVEAKTLERFIDSVDGFLFASSRMSDNALRHLAGIRPTFMLSRRVPGVNSVTPDTSIVMREAFDHLVGLGHAHLTYLSGPSTSWQDGIRWRALSDRSRQNGTHLQHLGPFSPTLRGGAMAYRAWRKRPTTGVIAYNDLMAIGFMREASADGCSVPGDVSLIGCDDIPFAQLLALPLTTVRINQYLIGVNAARGLLSIVGSNTPRSDVRDVVTPTDLAVRGSTGPTS